MSFPTDDAERKAFALLTFLTAYFPDAIEALVRLSQKGNTQHQIDLAAVNPFKLKTDRIAWDRSKSTDETETAMRHLWQHERAKRGVGSFYDDDGHLHIVKAMWRTGAESQRTIEMLGDGPSISEPWPLPVMVRTSGPEATAGVSCDEFDREFVAVDGLNKAR